MTIEQVAREPLILFAPGYFQRDFLDTAFAKRGLSPRIVLETDFVPLLVDATARGGGVTTLLRLAAEAEKRLVPLSFRPEISVEAGLAWRAGAYVSRASPRCGATIAASASASTSSRDQVFADVHRAASSTLLILSILADGESYG